MPFKLASSHEGLSLVESAIGMLVVAGVSYGMTQLAVVGAKNNQALVAASDANSVMSLISLALADSSTCKYNLDTTSLSAVTFSTAAATLANVSIGVNRLRYRNDQTLLAPGPTSTAGLTIGSMALKNFREQVSGTSYLADLSVSFNRANGAPMTRTVPVQLQTTAVGTTATLVDCGAGGTVGSSVPSGAVMAFDLAACPTGWTEYVAARGRAVVGVNPSAIAVNPSGEGSISVRARGSLAGSEVHSLTVAELPPHNHYAGVQNNTGTAVAFPTGAGFLVLGALTAERTTGNTGAGPTGNLLGQAHSIQQPSVALLICTKN